MTDRTPITADEWADFQKQLRSMGMPASNWAQADGKAMAVAVILDNLIEDLKLAGVLPGRP